MNASPQPQPGATMSYGLLRNWERPASFGTPLSAASAVMAADGPTGLLPAPIPEAPVLPQFCTTDGQQIGVEFFP